MRTRAVGALTQENLDKAVVARSSRAGGDGGPGQLKQGVDPDHYITGQELGSQGSGIINCWWGY